MASHVPFYIRENDPPAKREILRAAMRLFSEQGLAATSIRDIARESGALFEGVIFDGFPYLVVHAAMGINHRTARVFLVPGIVDSFD